MFERNRNYRAKPNFLQPIRPLYEENIVPIPKCFSEAERLKRTEAAAKAVCVDVKEIFIVRVTKRVSPHERKGRAWGVASNTERACESACECGFACAEGTFKRDNRSATMNGAHAKQFLCEQTRERMRHMERGGDNAKKHRIYIRDGCGGIPRCS